MPHWGFCFPELIFLFEQTSFLGLSNYILSIPWFISLSKPRSQTPFTKCSGFDWARPTVFFCVYQEIAGPRMEIYSINSRSQWKFFSDSDLNFALDGIKKNYIFSNSVFFFELWYFLELLKSKVITSLLSFYT